MMKYYINNVSGYFNEENILHGPYSTLELAKKFCTQVVEDCQLNDDSKNVEDFELEILCVTDVYTVDLSQKIVVEVVAPKIEKVPQGVSQ